MSAIDLPRPANRSWWLEEALALPEFAGEPCPPLSTDTTADVVILGAGYTGMWTAYFLKEIDPGVDVALLEADICGGGPSGRNGGFVNSFWGYVEDAVELFGEKRAVELCRATEETVHGVGEWCAKHGVDAWFTPAGDIGVASSPAQEDRWSSVMDVARSLGVDDRLIALTAEEVAERCRSPVFGGGMLTADAATVQPARLARGLRRVLLERGVRIFERTPATRFRTAPLAEAETPGGTARAGRTVIALNAWASRLPVFRRRLTVRGTYMVVTAPAPEKLEEIGWTSGVAIWNHRAAVNYLRTTNDGRIAFGTGGMQPGFGRSLGSRFSYDERFVEIVAAQFRRMFPSFADVPLESAWGGPIDVSATHLPFFGTLPSGTAHFGLGYTGNGVGPSHLGGRILAKLALGIDDEDTTLPLVRAEPGRFPPEPLKSAGALVVNQAILRKDATEDAGRKVDPVTGFLARLPRRLGYHLGS